MRPRRSRLRPGRLSESLFQSGSKFQVQGWAVPFRVQGSKFRVRLGTEFNSEPGTEKVKDGTTDQCHRFVLSVVDAVRGDRHCGGIARTVAV